VYADKHRSRPEVPTEQSAPCREPIFGQDLLAAADVGWDIFERHSQQQRGFGEMKDAIVPLGKHDHPVAGLLVGLAPPALPDNGLTV